MKSNTLNNILFPICALIYACVAAVVSYQVFLFAAENAYIGSPIQLEFSNFYRMGVPFGFLMFGLVLGYLCTILISRFFPQQNPEKTKTDGWGGRLCLAGLFLIFYASLLMRTWEILPVFVTAMLVLVAIVLCILFVWGKFAKPLSYLQKFTGKQTAIFCLGLISVGVLVAAILNAYPISVTINYMLQNLSLAPSFDELDWSVVGNYSTYFYFAIHMWIISTLGFFIAKLLAK